MRALLEPFHGVHGTAWIVGGALRDVLADRPVVDVDVAVDGDARPLARELATRHGATRFPLSNAFGAWRVQGGTLPYTVDLTPLQGGDLRADLARRDLTVNAMALPLAGDADLIDPHGGRGDLQDRLIRAVGPDAFVDDPVRTLRAARLSRALDADIESATTSLARDAAPLLWQASGERIRDELYRVMSSTDPAAALRLIDHLGVLGVFVPQLEDARGMTQTAYHHLDVLGHTLEVVEHAAAIAADPGAVFRGDGGEVGEVLRAPLGDGVSRREALMLAALLHDMAKPATRAVRDDGRVTFMYHDRLGAEQADELLGRLRVAGRVRTLVTALIRDHLKLGFLVHAQPLALRQMDRYLRATEPGEVEQLVLSVSDRLATDGPRTTLAQITKHLDLARRMLRTHLELRERGPIVPPLRGDELADRLNRPPGPWLSDVLGHLREVQLTRDLTPERALRIADEFLKNRG